jgi:beta-glucanase (GH16 family)
MKLLISLGLIFLAVESALSCTPTTASGTHAPRNFCSGDLIFEDNFDSVDQSKWRHDVTMWGGGNYEFQWYVNERSNTFSRGGNLHIKPTYTADVFGENFVFWGRAIIPPEECTNSDNWGCDRTANGENIINPIRSGCITSFNSFSFKYGIMEIRAKMPAGDWIWPALWMMPRYSVYGGWPRSGEIDLMELRGNRQLFSNGVNVGVEQAGHTMHFGPAWNINGWPTAHGTKNRVPGFDRNFHLYKLVWTEWDMQFYIDGELILKVEANDGFWKRGGFQGANIWANGSRMAPFDQEFYIIINNAVGGTMYFSDSFENRPNGKPWLNSSPTAMRDFWTGRSQWEPTWNLNTDDSHLQVDYVRVWAL